MHASTKGKSKRRKILWAVLGVVVLGIGIAVLLFVARLNRSEPVTYEDDVDHFKYGTIGSAVGCSSSR